MYYYVHVLYLEVRMQEYLLWPLLGRGRGRGRGRVRVRACACAAAGAPLFPIPCCPFPLILHSEWLGWDGWMDGDPT